MAQQNITSFNGINTYSNPFNTNDGVVLHCLNLDSHPQGAKTKRSGYNTYLGTADGEQVNTLFSWTQDNGTALFTYRASGTSLYYSTQGTGAWTLCGNGTIADGANIGYAVLDNTMIIGDGSGTPKWTTNGTSFNEATAAPEGASSFVDYQGRIYCNGTESDMFYSTVGTASDWTTDSSSLAIPGPGKLHHIMKASDRIIASKNSGVQFRWDGNELTDMATELGPSSPRSVAAVEDFKFWINRYGVFTSNGSKPQLISNYIDREIYNAAGNGIVGSNFNTAPGSDYRYGYYVAVGTVTDEFTGITINDAIIKYDYRKNEFSNYQFANNPTAFHSYTDANGELKMIFGDANGQCYQLSGTAVTDNSAAIESSMMVMLHANVPHRTKDWFSLEIFASPGCQAKVQYAVQNLIPTGDTWHKGGALVWRELGDLSNGYTEFHFPSGTRGKFMYIRIYEAGKTNPWTIYSMSYEFSLRSI